MNLSLKTQTKFRNSKVVTIRQDNRLLLPEEQQWTYYQDIKFRRNVKSHTYHHCCSSMVRPLDNDAWIL